MKHSPALWAVAGAAITAIVLPGAASAVTSQIVSIADSTTGVKAAVDSAHRLRVAETAPANIVTIGAQVPDSCTNVYTVPSGKTLIVKNVYASPNGSGNNSEVSFFANGTCTGTSFAQGLIFVSGGSGSNAAIDLGPGVVVKGGESIAVTTNNSFADVHLYGYLTSP